MTKSQAKKIAYRRAWLILTSHLKEGWDPNEHGEFSYSVFDTRKILRSMIEILDQMARKSIGNIEARKPVSPSGNPESCPR